MSRVPDPKQEWEDRADVFGRSYAEVLAFIKHEDDKIGRVLTALAFLTAAGVSLFIFSSHPGSHPLLFTRPRIDVSDFSFALFMVSLLLSLLAILSAVDPTTQTPRFLAITKQPEAGSIVFYGDIYRGAAGGWPAADTGVPELFEKLSNSFHADALELSRRAKHKLARFADSRAFMQISIVSLTVLGVARIDAIDVHWRAWIVVAVLMTVALLPLYDIGVALHFRFANLQGEIRRSLVFSAPAWLAVALLAYSTAIATPNLDFIFVAYTMFVIVASRFILRADERQYIRWSVAGFGMGVLAIVLHFI